MSEWERIPMLGKYRLIAELGRGGMAEVFLAVANPGKSFTKLVVIKKPREHLANDVDFMTMLVDEARIAARLNHPSLVQTLEVGEANGEYFLTMEYLEGQPLHRLLARARGSFPLDMHLSVLIDVCRGIHYAHELKDFDGTSLGVIHRDVTPHNVFVTYEGQVKVVDFGIAKAVGRAGETRHGVIKGKIPYMAPEQAAGKEVDRRVDIFSVGVMCFEAAVRHRMWRGVMDIDVIRRLVAGNIPSSPRSVDPNVDEELDRICVRALSARTEDRYPTAAELQEDLEGYLASRGPRPSARLLGTYCSQLFAKHREATRAVIEKQLAVLKNAPRSLSVPPTPPVSMSPNTRLTPRSPPLPPPISAPPIVHAPPEPIPGSVRDDSRSSSLSIIGAIASVAHAKRQRNLALLVAFALAVATAVMTFLALRPTAPADAPDAGESNVPALGGNITVTLRASPIEAHFTIDDGPLLDNPFIGTYPRDGRQHVIRATALGYAAGQEAVVFKEDVSLRFALRTGEANNNKKK